MCGIVGYTGRKPSVPLLLDGLRHLEYRGYDSAGIAVISPSGGLEVRKALGKLDRLAEILAHDPPEGGVGIGHTRWATHGRPSDENAHPHVDCTGRLCVVHNGVVENFAELRLELQREGHTFASETDTEVLAHLIERELDRPGNEEPDGMRLVSACRLALAHVRGLYAIAVVSLDEPDVVVGARSRAPLIVGLSEDGNFLASAIPAVMDATRRMIRLHEGDLAVVRPEGVDIVDRSGQPQERDVEEISWDESAAEKEGYPHFFLKEVHEQPDALDRTLAGRLADGRIQLPELDPIDVSRVRRILLTGCGSAYHACMMARYAYESWLRVPVEVDIASELRYREPVVDDSVLCIAVSQSGETADTLAAFELVGEMKAQRLAVTNVVGSAITTLADAVMYQHSGPEIAVVASKTFSGQIASLLLIGLALAARGARPMSAEAANALQALGGLADCVREALATTAQEAARIGERNANVDRLLFLGRGVGYPTALEGALKLKEISYIHAEGYAAGELKHGPLALVEPGSLVVVLATRSATQEKLISNVEEVRARGGRIVAIASVGDSGLDAHADEIIRVPETLELLSPLVNVVPMQLLAYHAAVARGCDPDKPRNLAKSVTVE
jgi:glutamine---fructose-6-phosphate transaminase (isomerizing)